MKPLLNHSIFLILSVCCCINSYAVTDSLPACIKNITTTELHSFSEYEYKGRELFSFVTVAQATAKETSDKMTTTRFYDLNCTLICTWIKGGIAGLNKIIPDSIQKEKIILLKVTLVDTVAKKKPASVIILPDTIIKIALLKKSNWIEETVYDGKTVYRFQNPFNNPSNSKVTFVNPLYNENGNIVAPVKFMRRGFWWHNVNGKFSRTQFRPGYR